MAQLCDHYGIAPLREQTSGEGVSVVLSGSFRPGVVGARVEDSTAHSRQQAHPPVSSMAESNTASG